MCVYSNVLDHYIPLIPEPFGTQPYQPITPLTQPGQFPWMPQVLPDELRKLLDEFKEALAAAKTVDRLVGHPDCEDPEKAKLVARVAELEALLGPGRSVKGRALMAIADILETLPEIERPRVLRSLATIYETDRQTRASGDSGGGT